MFDKGECSTKGIKISGSQQSRLPREGRWKICDKLIVGELFNEIPFLNNSPALHDFKFVWLEKLSLSIWLESDRNKQTKNHFRPKLTWKAVFFKRRPCSIDWFFFLIPSSNLENIRMWHYYSKFTSSKLLEASKLSFKLLITGHGLMLLWFTDLMNVTKEGLANDMTI